jgi:acyl transferase domain-containing protein
MSFSPIAIVGRACLLPGADSPEALWQLVESGRVVVGSAPEGRWALDRARISCSPDSDGADATWSDQGGYVRNFDAEAVGLGELSELDPVCLWSLHVARQCWADSQSKGKARIDSARAGAIFGNLSFPSAGMARYAAETWFGDEATRDELPFNRFNSSGPAQLVASQLGLGADTYCLDAACASALYAIKLACVELQAGRADFMLAGAVNSTDDLFIHVGFCALQAMSRSGRSRPFHTDADGLVPAEGAAFVGLMRLSDALQQGRQIHGVIRGVGLSNDGRGRGLLSPMAEGQARAIRSAYDQAGIAPSQIGLLECHATGTSVGDAIEIESSQSVFADVSRRELLPLASLKSNMGHLITAAGAAGLIKVLESMKRQRRAPSAGFERGEVQSHEHPALRGSRGRNLGFWFRRKQRPPRGRGIRLPGPWHDGPTSTAPTGRRGQCLCRRSLRAARL